LLLYFKWERADRHNEYRFVMDKTQVALLVKITILRMELVAVDNTVRLARRVRESLQTHQPCRHVEDRGRTISTSS
jgi:hypothetical protein